MPVHPKLISISDACHMIGIGRTKLYGLINDRSLEIVKIGRRTLVTMKSVKALVKGRTEKLAQHPPLYSHMNDPIRPILPAVTPIEAADEQKGQPIFSRNFADGEN